MSKSFRSCFAHKSFTYEKDNIIALRGSNANIWSLRKGNGIVILLYLQSEPLYLQSSKPQTHLLNSSNKQRMPTLGANHLSLGINMATKLNYVFVCLLGVFRPTREFFTYMETLPLPVKGCKFWSMLDTYGHWTLRFFLSCHTYCDTGHPFIMVISEYL